MHDVVVVVVAGCCCCSAPDDAAAHTRKEINDLFSRDKMGKMERFAMEGDWNEEGDFVPNEGVPSAAATPSA